jgi:hypothetical protein
MPIFKLVTDTWNGRSVEETAKESPSWDDVVAAIKCLDADKRTLVAADGWGETQMLIGGGAGKYVVSVSTSDEELFTLINSDAKASDRVLVNAGGQTGNFPSQEIVDYETAIQAANWFYEHNEPAPQLVWKKN